MRITYTKHAAVDKFAVLKRHGFKLTRKLIEKVVTDPEHVDMATDRPKIIVSRVLDGKHVLRVVYRKESDTITVITFFTQQKKEGITNES